MLRTFILFVLISVIGYGAISYAQTLDVPIKDENIKESIVLELTPEQVLKEKRDKMTIPQIIEEVAPMFNQDPKLISKIAYCESKFKNVVHDGGHGKGVTGIHKKTFDFWLVKYKKENNESLDYNSSYDQLKMMAFAFSKGDSYRNQWSTYRSYRNGGTYSFYSNLLKKNFTVKCI
jgi:hypothetical protein